jgi:hypothetical protein
MLVWRSSFILPAAILHELLRNFFRGEEIYEEERGGSQLALRKPAPSSCQSPPVPTHLDLSIPIHPCQGGLPASTLSSRVSRPAVEPERGFLTQTLKPDLFSDTYVRAEARTLQRPEFPEAFVGGPKRRLAIDISSRVDIALHSDWEENETRKCLIASPRSEVWSTGGELWVRFPG